LKNVPLVSNFVITSAFVALVGPFVGGILVLAVFHPLALLIFFFSLLNFQIFFGTIWIMYLIGFPYALSVGLLMSTYAAIHGRLPFFAAPASGLISAIVGAPVVAWSLPKLGYVKNETDQISMVIICVLVSSLFWFPVQNFWNYNKR
jgi:hypothetical protein